LTLHGIGKGLAQGAIFGLVALLALPGLAEEKKYTAKDLNALIDNEEWGEFIRHAKDVSPAERDAKWKKNLEKAAMASLDDAAKQSPQEAFAYASRLHDEFKVLKKSKAYMAHRGKVGLAALKNCFGQRYGGVACYELMTNFVAGDQTNVDLNYEAGKLARLNMNHNAATPFFYRAIKNAKAKRQKKICGDKDALMAFKHTIAGPDGPDVKSVRELLEGTCKKELKGPFLEELYTNNTYVARNTCDIFLKGKGLTPFQQAHCADKGGK